MGNWVYRMTPDGDNQVGYYVWPWKFVVIQNDLSMMQARDLVHYLNGGG